MNNRYNSRHVNPAEDTPIFLKYLESFPETILRYHTQKFFNINIINQEWRLLMMRKLCTSYCVNCLVGGAME